jgi:putative hemolysin
MITLKTYLNQTSLFKKVPWLFSSKFNATYLNDVSRQIKKSQAISMFCTDLLDKVRINVNIAQNDISNIPKNGGFIMLSNHPFGSIDAILLLSIVLKVRPDCKLLSHKEFDHIKGINNTIIPANSLNKEETIINCTKSGQGIIIFPSHYEETDIKLKQSTDPKWSKQLISIIANAKVPVVPVYLNSPHSKLFDYLKLIQPILFNKPSSHNANYKNKDIFIRIGSIIDRKTISIFDNIPSLSRYLRARTYVLGTKVKLDDFRFQSFKLKSKNTPKELINPVKKERLQHDVMQLSLTNLIEENDEYGLFLVEASDIPFLITEIGRLRELTFRTVGEGTNQPLDLDSFDWHYHHLFLWHKNESKVVGAYRIGMGKDIIKAYGKKGFYTNSLFKFKDDFEEILINTMELGRSFIVPEFQKKAKPLFMMWEGILKILNQNSYKYLLGPVSISGSYTDLSKKIMTNYIKELHFDHDLAKLVKPRNKYAIPYFKSNSVDIDEILIHEKSLGFKHLNKVIKDIEQGEWAIPILIKKYLNQNARILAFNKDPLFNNAIDALMIIKTEDIALNNGKFKGD